MRGEDVNREREDKLARTNMILLICPGCGGPLKPSESYYNEGQCAKCRKPTKFNIVQSIEVEPDDELTVSVYRSDGYEEHMKVGSEGLIDHTIKLPEVKEPILTREKLNERPVVLIGGNPKGYDIPFHPRTLSGNRIRAFIRKSGIICELADMTLNLDDIPSPQEIWDLQDKYEGYQVIFLGRFVETALIGHFPDGIYLPHPANRSDVYMKKLVKGLEDIARAQEQEK